MSRARAHPTHEKDEVEATTPTSGAFPLRSSLGADPETRTVAGWSQHVQRPPNGPAPGTHRVFSHRSHIRSVEGDASSATAAPEVPAPSEAAMRAKPFQNKSALRSDNRVESESSGAHAGFDAVRLLCIRKSIRQWESRCNPKSIFESGPYFPDGIAVASPLYTAADRASSFQHTREHVYAPVLVPTCTPPLPRRPSPRPPRSWCVQRPTQPDASLYLTSRLHADLR